MTPKRRVIPIFVPHLGCPNDCVFCNQRRISGQLLPATPTLVTQVLSDACAGLPLEASVQVAFYGGSFTAIPAAEQNVLLDAAAPFLKKYTRASLRISTRPDAVDKETLTRLIAFGVRTIELGAQSMCDDVLVASGRGHTAKQTVEAAQRIKELGLELILQMMTGLPADTAEKALLTAQRLIELKPEGVRIYPTVVIRATKLHELWLEGSYVEHTVEDAVRQCAELYGLFDQQGIPIIRLGLNPTEDLSGGDAVAGAYHPAFGELVYARVYLNKARTLLTGVVRADNVTLGVSKGHVSQMVGQSRRNIEILKQEFGLGFIKVVETDVAPGEINIIHIENIQKKGYNSKNICI